MAPAIIDIVEFADLRAGQYIVSCLSRTHSFNRYLSLAETRRALRVKYPLDDVLLDLRTSFSGCLVVF